MTVELLEPPVGTEEDVEEWQVESGLQRQCITIEQAIRMLFHEVTDPQEREMIGLDHVDSGARPVSVAIVDVLSAHTAEEATAHIENAPDKPELLEVLKKRVDRMYKSYTDPRNNTRFELVL